MSEYLAENARLRQLSRRLAEGQLPLAEFRAARRELLNALEAGRVQAAPPVEPTPAPRAPEPSEATGIRAAEMSPPEEATMFFKTLPPEDASADEAAALPAPVASWDSHTRVLALVLGVSLLLALGALIYVFAL
jgi:hypothetical protein